MGGAETPAGTVTTGEHAAGSERALTLQADPTTGRLRWSFDPFAFASIAAYGSLSPAGPAGVVSYRGVEGVELRLSRVTGGLSEIVVTPGMPSASWRALTGLLEWEEPSDAMGRRKPDYGSVTVGLKPGAGHAFRAWMTALTALDRIDTLDSNPSLGMQTLRTVDALAALCRAVELGFPESRLVECLADALGSLLGAAPPPLRLRSGAAQLIEGLLDHGVIRAALGASGVAWLHAELALTPNRALGDRRSKVGCPFPTAGSTAEVLNLGLAHPEGLELDSLRCPPGELPIDPRGATRSSVTVTRALAEEFGLVAGRHAGALRVHPGWFELKLTESTPTPWYLSRWVHCFDGDRLIGAGPMRLASGGLAIRMWDLSGAADGGRATLVMTGHPWPPAPDGSIVRLYAEAVRAARHALAAHEMGDAGSASLCWRESAACWLALGSAENAGWAWRLAEPHPLSGNATLRSQLDVLAAAPPCRLKPTPSQFIAPLAFDSGVVDG
jgi:hypothetical protein